MADQRLEVGADGAEACRSHVEGLPGDVCRGGADRRLDEILDREQLVAVRAVSQDRDAAALADPVEQDLEDAEALRADERLGPQDDDLEPAAPRPPGDPLRLDLRFAVVPDSDERRVLAQRVVLGDPVDGRRRDQHRPADARLEGGGERDRRAVHVRRVDRVARGLDRKRRGRMHDHVGPVHEAGHGGGVAHVPSQLFDVRLELLVVERREIEGPHLVAVRDEPPGEVETEEARAAGDGPPHQSHATTSEGIGP